MSSALYTKRRWVDGVVGLGLHAVGKLRQDANLKYLYSGSRRPDPGAQKKYDGKVTVAQPDLSRLEPVETLDDGTEIFTAIVWSVSLHRQIRWVYLRRTQNRKPTYAMLFSSDLTLSAPRSMSSIALASKLSLSFAMLANSPVWWIASLASQRR